MNEQEKKYDIVYGYEDDKGAFVQEGAVEPDMMESEPVVGEDGLIDSKVSAERLADEMNKAAREYYAEDLAEGVAEPTGPVVHKAVPAEVTADER